MASVSNLCMCPMHSYQAGSPYRVNFGVKSRGHRECPSSAFLNSSLKCLFLFTLLLTIM